MAAKFDMERNVGIHWDIIWTKSVDMATLVCCIIPIIKGTVKKALGLMVGQYPQRAAVMILVVLVFFWFSSVFWVF